MSHFLRVFVIALLLGPSIGWSYSNPFADTAAEAQSKHSQEQTKDANMGFWICAWQMLDANPTATFEDVSGLCNMLSENDAEEVESENSAI